MCMYLHEFTWIYLILDEFMWIKTILFECLWIYMNINMILFKIYLNLFDLFWIYTKWCKYVLNLFENMHTAGWLLLHTTSPLDSHTLPRASNAGQPHTAAHTMPRTAALPDKAVRSAAHCHTLHKFECCTPHTAHCTPHTAAHRNSHEFK
jgi:hypothetical protein